MAGADRADKAVLLGDLEHFIYPFAMEPEIYSNLPGSSPLLAYGEARGPNLGPKLLAILAGSLVVGAFLVGIVLFLRLPVPFPKDAPLVMAVHGGIELPDNLPTLWRDAVKQSSQPVLVGLARTENGFQPFALLPRWSNMPSSNSVVEGVTKIVSDVPLNLSHDLRARDLSSFLLKLFRHPAYAQISATGNIHDRTMSGSLDGKTWRTETMVTGSSPRALPDGDISVDLASLPDAWPAINDALARSGFLLDTKEMPSALGWTMTTGSTPILALQYDDGLSTSTLLAIAAATGVYDEHPSILPDGTYIAELRLPFTAIQALETATSSGLTPLRLEGTTLYIGDRKETAHIEPICQEGRPIMRFSEPAMQNMAFAFAFLESFQVQDVEMVESGGKLVVCWR